MATAKASVHQASIPPRKARLVADLIRGKNVAEAREILYYTARASAPVIRKVLESAVASAENAAAEARARIDTDEMIVSSILVNEGRTLRKWRPAARGRAVPRRKRSSHIELVITEK